MTPAWALDGAPNPAVLRLHVTQELTDHTIVTCPPGDPRPPLDQLLGIEGVRSIDLHRYRARLNLVPTAARGAVISATTALLRQAWGDPAPLLIEELPRAFEVRHGGPRQVAESLQMAEDEPVLEVLFEVAGVAEAIAGDGLVLVRLGRLFRWDDVQRAVQAALA